MDKGQTPHKDSFIFSGNKQESVPRTLFLDQRLTPLERNAWQVIRMMLQADGITAVPTYEELRPYLTSMPYAEKASFETVARALTILRLTRWLSLAKKRRAKEGAKQSNLYILHDEPLTPFEAMRLDDDYLALVCQSITHSSKAIQRVAAGILQDIADDPFLAGKRLPTRIEILLGRVADQTEDNETENNKKLSTTHKSEDSLNHLLRNQKTLTSESGMTLQGLENQSIRNPNKVVSSSNNINILLQTMVNHLQIPERFYQLSEGRQHGILITMQHLSPAIQQQVLIEWDDRCRHQSIHNPAAYLYGIVQKAYKGQFNDLVEPEQPLIKPQKVISSKVVKNPSDANDINKPRTQEELVQIKQHLQTLREIIFKK